MGKAKWTRWGGGHGRLDAYTLELGRLIRADVKRRGQDHWELTINSKPIGDYPTREAAMQEADARVGIDSRDFLEDWVIWTVGLRAKQ